jgi:hypothetical protein
MNIGKTNINILSKVDINKTNNSHVTKIATITLSAISFYLIYRHQINALATTLAPTLRDSSLRAIRSVRVGV